MRYKVTVKLEFRTDAISPINAKLEFIQLLHNANKKLRANQAIEQVDIKIEELSF